MRIARPGTGEPIRMETAAPPEGFTDVERIFADNIARHHFNGFATDKMQAFGCRATGRGDNRQLDTLAITPLPCSHGFLDPGFEAGVLHGHRWLDGNAVHHQRHRRCRGTLLLLLLYHFDLLRPHDTSLLRLRPLGRSRRAATACGEQNGDGSNASDFCDIHDESPVYE